MTNENLSNDKTTGQPDNLDVIPKPTHPTKTSKYLNRAVILSFLAIAVALGIFFKWSFTNSNVLEVKNNPFPARVLKDESHQTGGVIFLKVNYCKNQDVTGELRMSYVSKSREIFIPISKEQFPIGCHTQELPVIIPLNLVQDSYKIKFRVIYNLNPIKHDITGNFESQPVIVGSHIAD